MNNQYSGQQLQPSAQPPIPNYNQQIQLPAPSYPVVKEKREYTLTEKLLLPISLVIAILFDRLLFAQLFQEKYPTLFFSLFIEDNF